MIFPHLPEPLAAQCALIASDMDRFCRLASAEQNSLVGKQLFDLFNFARGDSAFWQDRLGQMTSGIALTDLPIMTRQELQQHSVAMRTETASKPVGANNPFLTRTSGSTGRPVEVLRHRQLYPLLFHAITLLEARWHGLDVQKTMAVIKDVQDGVQSHWGLPFSGLGQSGRLLMRNLVEHTDQELWSWVQAQPADYLLTTPALLQRFCDFAEGEKALPHWEKILTFGEVVTPELRADCFRQFGARMIDRYTCEEAGWIALQCPVHDHYHVLSPTCLVELVDEQGHAVPAGVPGRVLVTSLHSYAQPIIRYDIGDVAVGGTSCDCGLKLPVLQRIEGRERSFLRLPDGSQVLARLTGEYWRQYAPVEAFRLVQQADGSVTVSLVAAREISADELTAMATMLRDRISPLLTYNIRQVSEINWEHRWKRTDVMRLDS